MYYLLCLGVTRVSSDVSEGKANVFGTMMVIPNRLDKLMEQKMAPYEITSKQWLLTALVEKVFQRPPTVKEAAKAMGSSHQNVKQVALKLESKGFMELQKDARDQRVTRLWLTEKSKQFWEAMDRTCNDFIEDVFRDMEKDEILSLQKGIEKIMANIVRMEGNPDEDEEK